MGYFPFANSRFQMGVTVMGFAEDFGHEMVAFGTHEFSLFFVSIIVNWHP